MSYGSGDGWGYMVGPSGPQILRGPLIGRQEARISKNPSSLTVMTIKKPNIDPQNILFGAPLVQIW